MVNIEDRDPGYFWLRHTEELTIGGRRRTLEVAVPVRFGATPDEIARALDEAVAGIDGLAERMERRVAALRAAAPAPPPPAAHHASIAERPSAPTRPAPSAGGGRAAPASAGGLSRAEFLEQARSLDLSPRQVMDRLGVRTLEGLNYTEALEQIRRQLLRESTQVPRDTASPPQAAPVEPARATSEAPTPATASKPVKYFDEEDDYDMTFELPGGEEGEELDLDALDSAPDAAALGTAAGASDLDAVDLDDVPDFAEPPAATRRQSAAKPPASSSPASAPAADVDGPAPSRPTSQANHQALAQRARARELLARLREYHVGSPAGSDQLGPFTHVVIEQLGEEKVTTLTQRVWGIAPEALTAQQMRALVQWGKTDPFATEVHAVLDLLASEQPADTAAEAKDAAARNGRAPSRPAARGAGGAR